MRLHELVECVVDSGALFTAAVVAVEGLGRTVGVAYHELTTGGAKGEPVVESISARRVRPLQTAAISRRLLEGWIQTAGAGSAPAAAPTPTVPGAAPSATSLALARGFYSPGRAVDVWAQGGWWAATIEREISEADAPAKDAPQPPTDAAAALAASSQQQQQQRAKDAALPCVPPSGVSSDPAAYHCADISRVFQVRVPFSSRACLSRGS
jgi:hypothetical protein